ncbi:hypothetical protein [Limnohabitans sp.]|jgi:hypothetical protein|uniref:hypothetical protein n=1 Tax=Limnohabitans sp. TaxID=1907725 RepID=UPI0037C104FA
MNKILIGLTLFTGLSGCGLDTTQAFYEEIRAQKNAKALGTGAAPSQPLPRYKAYEKERGQLFSTPP